jgi:UDP-glucuronate decarboxylase
MNNSPSLFREGNSWFRNLVTGGAGFVGSHLVDRLMEAGEEVICLDNYFTGRKTNIAQWIGHPRFELIRHDVTEPIRLEVDRIWHLACPASPVHYQHNPIKTAKTSFLGTYNMLGLARRVGARLLLASTSEVYGDPEVHPQPESYRGCVNTIGIRSCYDEGKRVAVAEGPRSGNPLLRLQAHARHRDPRGANLQHLWAQDAAG